MLISFGCCHLRWKIAQKKRISHQWSGDLARSLEAPGCTGLIPPLNEKKAQRLSEAVMHISHQIVNKYPLSFSFMQISLPNCEPG